MGSLTIGKNSEQLMCIAAHLPRIIVRSLKSRSQIINLGKPRQQLQGIEQIAFAGTVGANDNLKGGQFYLKVFERLEAVYLNLRQHGCLTARFLADIARKIASVLL